MRILIVSATEFEISKLKEALSFSHDDPDQGDHNTKNLRHISLRGALSITFLTTGVGMVATAFSLGRHFGHNPKDHYDLAINLGIAGSFDRNIALGEVVEITEDTLTELGAEDDETFLPIEQLGFGESVFRSSYSLPDGMQTKQAAAITVNTVHGNEDSIQKLGNRINAQIESMEGAAFFYACREAGIPCMQIRAVSNYVEKRNRDAWQIGLAIKNLNTFAAELIEKL